MKVIVHLDVVATPKSAHDVSHCQRQIAVVVVHVHGTEYNVIKPSESSLSSSWRCCWANEQNDGSYAEKKKRQSAN